MEENYCYRCGYSKLRFRLKFRLIPFERYYQCHNPNNIDKTDVNLATGEGKKLFAIDCVDTRKAEHLCGKAGRWYQYWKWVDSYDR